MSQRKEELSLAAVHLERALGKKEGCPIGCRVRETKECRIWYVLYELTGDPEVHKQFAASLGLRREHAALMAQVVQTRELVTPTIVTQLYEIVVVHALATLADLSWRRKSTFCAECPLCALAKEAEDRESWFLGELLGDPKF